MTITEGEIATAESTEGAKDPTDIPMADAAIDSNVSILRKLMNLPGPEFKPHSLYLIIIIMIMIMITAHDKYVENLYFYIYIYLLVIVYT